jgi:pyridoxal phosphate enzyme (YggS family)
VADSRLSLLKDRVKAVEDRLRAACQRAGRRREDVRLVAVTKTISAELAGLLPQLGIFDLGESRPQELWRKAAALPTTVHWHLIGHLQRNKIERTLPLVHLIHSVDSLRLLEALDHAASNRAAPLDLLLEVNLSGEQNKHGFRPEEMPDLVEPLTRAKHLRIRGLMTMAALVEDPEAARPTFAALRAWRDRLQDQLGSIHPLQELSMGMTNDLEVAVEEGATLVRIGSALFENLV